MTLLNLEHDPASEGLWEKYGSRIMPAIIAAIVSVTLTCVSWGFSQSRGGAIADAKLEAVNQRVDKAATREEVEALREQMNDIREDTRYLRQRIDTIYGIPESKRPTVWTAP